MDKDWLADVRRFAPDADEGVVAAIVKYCGIALRTEDASKVTFSEAKETERVRENYLKKKLGRTDSDAALDAAIASTGERMGGGDQNRVSVYYLLADHFGMLDTFGGAKGGVGATAATATAAAATTAAAAPAAAAPATPSPATPSPAPIATAMSSGGGSSAPTAHSTERDSGGGDDMVATGCLVGAIALGAIILSALIAVWVSSAVIPEEAEEPAAPVAVAPAPAPEPAVPEGAGVTATERDGRPMLSVYFDSGSSDVTPDFETVSADLRAYLDANPDASVHISGFNDPTGNAELNAALSRDRAMNVQAALVGLGLAEDRTDLVRPDDTTTTDVSPEEARRVEITIVE